MSKLECYEWDQLSSFFKSRTDENSDLNSTIKDVTELDSLISSIDKKFPTHQSHQSDTNTKPCQIYNQRSWYNNDEISEVKRLFAYCVQSIINAKVSDMYFVIDQINENVGQYIYKRSELRDTAAMQCFYRSNAIDCNKFRCFRDFEQTPFQIFFLMLIFVIIQDRNSEFLIRCNLLNNLIMQECSYFKVIKIVKFLDNLELFDILYSVFHPVTLSKLDVDKMSLLLELYLKIE